MIVMLTHILNLLDTTGKKQLLKLLRPAKPAEKPKEKNFPFLKLLTRMKKTGLQYFGVRYLSFSCDCSAFCSRMLTEIRTMF